MHEWGRAAPPAVSSAVGSTIVDSKPPNHLQKDSDIMKNVWLAGGRGPLGSSRHLECMFDYMSQIPPFGRLVKCHDVFQDGPVLDLENNDIVIQFKPVKFDAKKRPYLISWAIFETENFPQKMLSWLGQSHEIWTPSSWARNVLIRRGISQDKIFVVPEGVSRSQFHSIGHVERDQGVKLLSVGALSQDKKISERKGFEDLIRSFLDADFDPAVVSLTLKFDSFLEPDRGYAQARDLLEKYACPENVCLVSGNLPVEAMGIFYRTFHAYVSATRGEAWGLPIIEAASCGLPLVSPVHTGISEYLSPIRQHIYEVNTEIVGMSHDAVYDERWTLGRSEQDEWCQVDRRDLTEKIRSCVSDVISGRACKSAETVSAYLRDEFCWSRAAEKAWKRLISGPLAETRMSVDLDKLVV